jgi:hypothetical protein
MNPIRSRHRLAAALATLIAVATVSPAEAAQAIDSARAPAQAPDAAERTQPTAEGSKPTTKPFHADAEFDPTAYVLSGYSLHVGLGYGHVRFDLGAFALDLPSFVHGNDGFTSSFDGYGAKLQLFPFAEQRGPLVGIDGGTSRMLVTRENSAEASRQRQFSAGVHFGWRIALPAGFYATPWLGVSYAFGAHDVTLSGATYRSSSVVVFPAIHLGYRFL